MLVLSVHVAWSNVVFGYTLYGYEDAYGIVHLNETKASDKHVLLYSGAKRPKWGFQDIKKRIKALGAVDAKRNKKWIKKHIKPYSTLRKGRGLCRKKPKDKKILRYIEEAAKKHRIDPKLVYAVIQQESCFETRAVSPKGARGLMQIMPQTQAHFGLKQPFDPKQNINTGARYLRILLDKFNSLPLALAAYNAGPAAVERYKGVPPYAETKNYVSKIMSGYSGTGRLPSVRN